MDNRLLNVLFWAILVNTVFILFSLTRIFAAREVRYGLLDLFNPDFYRRNPIFIALAIIGPVTFISDLMVFSAAGDISARTLGLLGLTALNLVGVVFGFLQFVLVNVLFATEHITTKAWLLLGFWFTLVVVGTFTGALILNEFSTS